MMAMARLAQFSTVEGQMMQWNKQPIPHSVALRIGWNLPIDVVGAGVYGGVVARDASGRILVGDEWPEDNLSPPAHNPVHSTGPYLDFSRFSEDTMGYTQVCCATVRKIVARPMPGSCQPFPIDLGWPHSPVFHPAHS